MFEQINAIRKSVKDQNPLVHCITNPISINQCANAVLAVGASPIMAEHPEEVAEITSTAKALVLNLGNITDVRMKSMLISSEVAYKNGIPFVIDAVGIACSRLRYDFLHKLLKYKPSLIKGNYSEVNSLYNRAYKSSGVDAKLTDEKTITEAAVWLAKKYECIVLASGKTDIVTDGDRFFCIKNGTPSLAGITGTGCMLGVLCGCYLSVRNNIYGVIAACSVLGICGELAKTDAGNGTFFINLLDKLSNLSDTDIEKNLRMEKTEYEKL